MNIKECYELIGANYEDVLGWLFEDSIIEKFARKFAGGNYYQPIEHNLSDENYEGAFKGIHTMKGVAANLGFNKLYDVSSVLCEELRPGKRPDVDITDMLRDVREEYERILDIIEKLD